MSGLTEKTEDFIKELGLKVEEKAEIIEENTDTEEVKEEKK